MHVLVCRGVGAGRTARRSTAGLRENAYLRQPPRPHQRRLQPRPPARLTMTDPDSARRPVMSSPLVVSTKAVRTCVSHPSSAPRDPPPLAPPPAPPRAAVFGEEVDGAV